MTAPGTRDDAPRTGVYICHCGTNIAGVVDVAEVRDWALEHLADKGVVVARDYPFMCSSLGQELIEQDIKEHGLERVVVGACSPHMHEKTFREASANAGLNPYLTELVSIREQVSWVHTDKARATEKAKAIIAGGVYRVNEHVPLEPLVAPVNPATLIVGGGIAGITAALEIADAGYPVHIVEREPSIGGHMAQYDKTFPTLDCAACILTPKMVDAGANKKITLHTWSEVVDVSGSVGDFKITDQAQAALREGGPLHGLRHLHREVPGPGRGHRLRGRHRLSEVHLHAVPAGGAQVPRAHAGGLHVLRQGHLQGLREVLPDGRHRLHPDRAASSRSRSATSSSPRASRPSTRGASSPSATGACPTSSRAWSSSA